LWNCIERHLGKRDHCEHTLIIVEGEMQMLPEFNLLMPKTLSEALEMLADNAPDVAPLAGGTNLIPDMRGGRHHPGVLVNVAGLDELGGVRREDGHLVVGGGVTIAELLDAPLIAQTAPVLREAASVLASPLVRNRATVGGNLANASPAADTAPPLLVLGAEVELASKEGTRRVPLEEFFVHVRETVCQPQELLTSVRWPIPTPDSVGRFRKLALRKADAVSVVNAAVMVEPDGNGRCGQVRIALGAVAPTPIRVHAAEDALRGQALTSEVIAEAAHLAAEATYCIDDVRGSADYRKRVVKVLVRRLLTEIAEEVK
jgi:CO/xanthine dehydrogenase FAD-binding subunit